MTVCTILKCHSRSEKHKKCDRITFHRFPVDPVLAHRWIKIVRLNRKEDWYKPTKHTKICSLHFHKKDIYTTKNGFRKIRSGALPAKRLYLSSSESDSDSNDNSEIPHSLENRKTEKYDDSRLSTCMSQVSIDTSVVQITKTIHTEPEPITSTGQVPKDPTVLQHEVQSTNTIHTEPDPDIDSSDLDSIFDSPRKLKLRRALRRKTALQIKHARLIKSLKQQNLRLKKRNALLKNIIISLKSKGKKQSNDVANISPQNVIAADL